MIQQDRPPVCSGATAPVILLRCSSPPLELSWRLLSALEPLLAALGSFYAVGYLLVALGTQLVALGAHWVVSAGFCAAVFMGAPRFAALALRPELGYRRLPLRSRHPWPRRCPMFLRHRPRRNAKDRCRSPTLSTKRVMLVLLSLASMEILLRNGVRHRGLRWFRSLLGTYRA